MGKPSRKQSSEKNPAGERFGSRQTQASILTANANLQQADKEEEKPWYKRTPVIGVLIPATVALLVAFFQFVLPILIREPVPRPQPHTFAGIVVDERGKVMQGAKVSLEAKGAPPVIYTDSEGAFSFPLSPDVHEIKIRVDAEGYIPFDRRINVTAKNELEDIRLTPLSGPSASSPTIIPDMRHDKTGSTENKDLSIQKPLPTPNKKASDLAKRKRQARIYLNSNSSTPTP